MKNRIAIVAWTMLLFACSGEKQAEQKDTYICPMHPTVVSDRPSTCPVCGMDLVRKARPGEEVKITEDLARLIKSPNESVVANIRTVKAEFKSLTTTLKSTGIVTYDTRNIYTIPSRIGGRLERVYLKYEFQHIAKGAKVADVYSPDLVAAQRDLLFLVENDPSNSSLIDAARTRLSLLGATKDQIDDLITSKEPSYAFSIYSPYDGYVITGDAAPPSLPAPATSASAGMESDGMGATVSRKTTAINDNAMPLIRPGNYVTAGQTLFSVVNPSALRVELSLPASQSGITKTGDIVQLDLGDLVVPATVDLIQPFLDKNDEFIKVRVYVGNHGLQVGQLIDATIDVTTPETLWLPARAVLDLGTEQIAFVKDRGAFKPKKITVGARVEGRIEVKQGILSADEVAADAQYLVDSESFIKSK